MASHQVRHVAHGIWAVLHDPGQAGMFSASTAPSAHVPQSPDPDSAAASQPRMHLATFV